MIRELDFEDFLKLDLDLLIDARSFKEYSHSKISKALNLPSLKDEEHEEIGLIYKKDKQKARIRAASYICKNMQAHLAFLDKNYKLNAKIGLYCARGGKRSLAQALILDQIGYKIFLLKGGFKAYRKYINAYFQKEIKLFLINLCGKTGVGKSDLLATLSPKIELEKLANHYGSSFGSILGPQPSQKLFEDSLFFSLESLKTEKLAFIEAESAKIGKLLVPKPLIKAMQGGFHIWCECEFELRVQRIARLYKDVDEEFFLKAMSKISPFISIKNANAAKTAFLQNNLYECISILLEYYDKSYKAPVKIDACINTNDIAKAKQDLQALLQA